MLRFRAGVRNFCDLINGNSAYRKTGTGGLNAATQLPNYISRYADPIPCSASIDVRS